MIRALKFLLVIASLSYSTVGTAQFYEETDRKTIPQKTKPNLTANDLDIGLGLGLDYGMVGAKLNYLLDDNIGVFAGAGTAIAGVGFNLGTYYKLRSQEHRSIPYLIGMYGSNAYIVVENASEYDKVYYGLSGGMGIEIHSRKNTKNFWNLALLLRIFSDSYNKDFRDLKNNPNIQTEELSNFTISLGYHFGIN